MNGIAHPKLGAPMTAHDKPQLVRVTPNEAKNGSRLLFPIAVTAVVGALFAYAFHLTDQQGKQAAAVAQYSSQNAKALVTLSIQVEKQAAVLQSFKLTNDQVIAELHNADHENADGLNRIKDVTDSLKKTTARLLDQQTQLRVELDRVSARLESPSGPTRQAQQQQQPQPTDHSSDMPSVLPTNHKHDYLENAPTPPGTVILGDNKNPIWLIQHDGKLQRVRPFDQIVVENGVELTVHNFTDGKDWLLMPGPDGPVWAGEAH